MTPTECPKSLIRLGQATYPGVFTCSGRFICCDRGYRALRLLSR